MNRMFAKALFLSAALSTAAFPTQRAATQASFLAAALVNQAVAQATPPNAPVFGAAAPAWWAPQPVRMVKVGENP